MFILHYAQDGVLDCNNKVTAYKTHTEALKAMLGQLSDSLSKCGESLVYDEYGLVLEGDGCCYETDGAYYARAGIWDSDEWHIYEV